MTSKKLGIALLSLVVLAIFAVAPAAAVSTSQPVAINISTEDTVFIGEAGLNISAVFQNGTKTIAWYAAGSSPKNGDAPKKVVTLTDEAIQSFYVDQGTFGGYTGAWFAYNSTEPTPAVMAFYVEEPSLNVKLFRDDGTTSVDGKKVIADDKLLFRVDSTFATLFERANTTANFDTTDFVLIAYNQSTQNMTINSSVVRGQEGFDDAYAQLLSTTATSGGLYLEREIAKVPKHGIKAFVNTPNNAKLTATIYVPNVNAAKYTSLTLQQIAPTRADYYVYSGYPIWNAGRIIDDESVLGHKILTGEYKFYAEININGMKDNLGEVSGKTRSNTATVTIDKETVTITADKETVIRNNGFSVKVEGKPKALYAVWFTGVNGYDYKEVPAFIQTQDGVTPMSWNQTKNSTYKNGITISTDLPSGVAKLNDGGTYAISNDYTGNYAVVAKLNAAGTLNIGLMTNENTKDTTFTIRAQRITDPDKTPLTQVDQANDRGLLNTYILDDQLYDTVKVKVEKGAVTISASGDGSYYLGEEVTLSGTNTDSDDVYLFITGPNLPVAGGKIDDPKTSPKSKGDSTKINVKTDDTWEYKWDTSGSILDAGTYTIYATSDFALKSGTNQTLSDVKYDTVSVVIKKPFVTATTSASTVAKGDKLYIRGTAEGNPTVGVGVWILGKNYWNGEKSVLMDSTMVTETVNDDGSFEHEIGSADTKDLASGQYFVVVQHPMYNGVFDVKTQKNEDAKTIQVITNPKGTEKAQVNGEAFIIAGSGKLQGSDAAEALITAINSANVDDTYTKLTFLVEEPWIRVNSVGDHYIGDQFKITGTTNLAVGDNLIVEVTSSSFQPTQKTQSGEFSGVSSTVKVTEGSSYNEWGLDVDASTFKADEYIVNVEAIEADVTTTTTFNILSGSATVAPTSAPTTAPTAKPTTAPTTAPTPAATASPGFGALVALIGLGAVAALIIRKD